jgi:hypothetical protein
MNEEYPLYPELDIIAQNQAEQVTKRYFENFKKKCIDILDELAGEYVSAIVDHIESDAWSNFRQEIIDGLCNYSNRKIQGRYDFDKIRKSIFDHYRNEIIEDLNQDLVLENEKLKNDLIYWKEKYEILLTEKYR